MLAWFVVAFLLFKNLTPEMQSLINNPVKHKQAADKDVSRRFKSQWTR